MNMSGKPPMPGQGQSPLSEGFAAIQNGPVGQAFRPLTDNLRTAWQTLSQHPAMQAISQGMHSGDGQTPYQMPANFQMPNYQSPQMPTVQAPLSPQQPQQGLGMLGPLSRITQGWRGFGR